ncbi:metal-dependent transcriptional regulator [Alkalibacterium pelagium]|uniref:Manganese transport regulator n=1 Tax=Alkalibacterium pelagium TaxID=426702 RepID=A0A1H7LI48_9LACT|nr:metal-dependent transcriptional regulator [Alkalibacterium pelagium]GEN50884.1 Cro/Cl family transcriptional regulator [Alkalibacterium pelagium]SEK98185.1 iron (metal) dependent repressor, DtxR family [Alkalibacterium pelagium]
MTPNKEDFIKAIFELGGKEKVVTNKDLVRMLSISAASVTDMNTRLLKEELITHLPYQGVMLTEKGLLIANQLIRKHRIWEVFLAEKLGYDWNEVHADADLLEHVSSDLLIERLNIFLEEPTFDPHGGVIPNQDGTVPEIHSTPLIECRVGDRFKIQEVDDQEDFLEYLLYKKVHLGKEYTLAEIEPYDGPLTLETPAGEKTVIGHKAAFKIFVDIIE